MSTGSFAEHLSGLDNDTLVSLLNARPDALVTPAPRSFEQLAQRLDGVDSLVRALRTVSRDSVVVGQAIVILADSATVPELATLLEAPEELVRSAVAGLLSRGLAWEDGGVLRLAERLAAHWAEEIGGGRPAAKMTHPMLVADLRTALSAFGVSIGGLSKPALSARLVELMADLPRLAEAVTRLSRPARERLHALRRSTVSYDAYTEYYETYRARVAASPPTPSPAEELLRAGLLLRVHNRAELPREVAVAAWLAEHRSPALSGPPGLPRADSDGETRYRVSQASAQEALRAVTSLLDEARTAPVTALKKGGVGPRERTRLGRKLSIAQDELVLWIDLSYAAGLLALAESGYVPTQHYQRWRAAEPSRRWAELVHAWYGLEHAPTSREIDGDRELPPPLPLGSAAGMLRRALLRAARSGFSVRAAGEEIDWFAPLHGYDADHRRKRVAAAVREAELLGVVAADTVSDLGEHLLAATGAGHVALATVPENVLAELARQCAALLPEAPCSVILQSDLTAMVSGQPGAAVVRLLKDCAVAEAHGAAVTWRFTPSSVRNALDGGWTADELLGELRTISAHPVPQPLEYLITDVARRHGQIRVRQVRSCLIAEEPLATEILHTRSLRRLHLSQLAPTVLASPRPHTELLARLRDAGFAPMVEDAQGAVIVEARHDHEAVPSRPSSAPVVPTAPRATLTATDLVSQLRADPDGNAQADAAGALTRTVLEQCNQRLCDSELELLADAVDHQRDVLITYRDKNGTRSTRIIRPQQLYGRWLDSWCHLRNAQRDFTVANIESVSPS